MLIIFILHILDSKINHFYNTIKMFYANSFNMQENTLWISFKKNE